MKDAKELSAESRLLLAVTLSILVLGVWMYLFPPKKPAPLPATPPPAQSAPAQPGTSPAAPAPVAGASRQTPMESGQAPAAEAASEEQTLVVENDLYRVELTNRGGVVQSWQLKKYRDSGKPPETLDVVHKEAAQQLGGWPLSVALEEPQQAEWEKLANSALYSVVRGGGSPRAPGPVVLEWSDGRLAVSKRLDFAHDYVIGVETQVSFDGKPLAHSVAWRSGFGDATVYNPAERVTVFYRTEGKLSSLAYKKLGNPDHRDERLRQSGTMEYAGMQDHYFAAAFLPRGAGLAFWHWQQGREITREGKKVKEPVAEMSAGSTVAGPVALRLFVGPKDLDVLGGLNPPMRELVDFGMFQLFAAPLFYFLKWIYNLSWVQNYGWAIVLMTIVLNTALFPLKLKSWRSMQKMQRVAPEIQAIQERYKKYAVRDPRKQEMQREVMAVYKREGVNPFGSCLPMLIQMPIWIALYSMLGVAIELRHAPWALWIRDLSAKDPYYVLPVLMGVTMYLMQQMTPMTTTDPAQQQMMKMMPWMFGGLFVIAPVSSGLVLYILTSNLVGIAQQWYLNRTGHPAEDKKEKGKKGKKA